MCGRAYETYTDEELELRYITHKRKRNPLGKRSPNYNLSPTQLSPIVFMRDNKIQIELFRWGLVPFWAKDIKSADQYSLINAKSEDISEKRSFKAAFQKRRCIVPLSGFFEWKKQDSGPKQPFAIHLKDEKIISVAGIWEHWESKETNETVHSFSIITCRANSFMKKIHNRMPVILSKEDESEWLKPENDDLESLKSLLEPCSSKKLNAFKISTLVNSPRNNKEEVLTPT